MTALARAPSRMDLWGPRRATSLKSARARTSLVYILRLLFTIGAILAAGWLLGTIIETSLASQGQRRTAPGESVTVIGPQFDGFDSHDRPYKLTADTARRRRDNPSLIDLANPRLKDVASSTVQARTGVWNSDYEVLDLEGDVVMTDAGGYTFTSQKVRVFVKENKVEGKVPLSGYGPIGEVRANQYEVLDGGDHIILRGEVWTRFKAKQPRAASGRGG